MPTPARGLTAFVPKDLSLSKGSQSHLDLLRREPDQGTRAAMRVVFLFDRPAHGRSPRGGRPEVFCQQLLEGDVVEHLLGQQLPQLAILSSSALRRVASDTSSPPYFDFQA